MVWMYMLSDSVLFQCMVIAHFPFLGHNSISLKKANEGLCFSSLVFSYWSLIFNNCYENEKKMSFFSMSCHFRLSLSASHGIGVSHRPLFSENSLFCHLNWWNPRPQVKLTSFLLEQRHVGDASKCKSTPGESTVISEVGLCCNFIYLVTSFLTAFFPWTPRPLKVTE